MQKAHEKYKIKILNTNVFLHVFGVEPEADALAHPPCTTGTLLGAGATDEHFLQGTHLARLHVPAYRATVGSCCPCHVDSIFTLAPCTYIATGGSCCPYCKDSLIAFLYTEMFGRHCL